MHTAMRKPRVTVLYHYLYPDDVVSARHYDGFCEGLVDRGWEVEARPCNRGCRDESTIYPSRSVCKGVAIHRVWRPPFRQATSAGRLLNAAWMISAWCGTAFRRKERLPDVMVIGTDPVLGVLVAEFVRRIRPGIGIAHWCYDVYPDAAVADGLLQQDSLVVRVARRLLRSAYSACDVIADLGPDMRVVLGRVGHSCPRAVTLVPWALREPAEPLRTDPTKRGELFGDASLGLLYSGNFGRAHSSEEFLALARRLRSDSIGFCFAARGNKAADLKAAVTREGANVRSMDFVPESELENHLGAADIHLVSLRPGWTGIVTPSKFFGSLAVGRPVLFAGSHDSSIAGWIREHGVGWVLDSDSAGFVAAELRRLAASKDELLVLQRRCHQVYQDHFCRRRIMDEWDRELKRLVNR